MPTSTTANGHGDPFSIVLPSLCLGSHDNIAKQQGLLNSTPHALLRISYPSLSTLSAPFTSLLLSTPPPISHNLTPDPTLHCPSSALIHTLESNCGTVGSVHVCTRSECYKYSLPLDTGAGTCQCDAHVAPTLHVPNSDYWPAIPHVSATTVYDIFIASPSCQSFSVLHLTYSLGFTSTATSYG